MPRKAKAPTAPDFPSDPAARRRLHKRLTGWFQRDGRDLPWRRTHHPYAILVSEFMLQQTQVATVIPYFERWLARFPDFATLAAAGEAEVLHAWQGLGYYARARNLQRAARQVVERHGGRLPGEAAAISALPGVGRYTAGAIANFAFNEPTAAVDANIARVLARLADLREPIDSQGGAEAVWRVAEALLPEKDGRLYTSALMELGALLCTPRQPQCPICPVRDFCRTSDPESLPVKKARRKTISLAEDCGWTVKERRVLLERQTGARWRGLWKLPSVEAPAGATPILEAEYPFTHHRVALRVFLQSAPAGVGEDQGWFTLNELEEAAMPSPHRRAAERLRKSHG